MTGHVLCDGSLGDINAEFQKFTVNSGRSPQWVVAAHRADQIARLFWNTWTSGPSTPSFPSPIPTEALPMPSDVGIRFNDQQRRAPSIPSPGEPDPKTTICRRQSWLWMLTVGDCELMTQSYDFQSDIYVATEPNSERPKQGTDDSKHSR